MKLANIYSHLKSCPRVEEQETVKAARTARIAAALAERDTFAAFVAVNPSRKHLADETEIAAWAAAR